jgi:hypothetical protein
MKKSLKSFAFGALAASALWVGSNLYQGMVSKNTEAQKSIPTQIESPGKVYAILANTSGPSEPNRFSEQNANYSMLNILSFYKFLKGKGVDDKDITLLMYNPTNVDLFKTNEYRSLEKKLSPGILPSEKDRIEIDGEATRNTFLSAINNLPLNPNNLVYIVISNPSPKEERDNSTNQISYGTRNTYLEFDKELVFPMDINPDPKNGKVIIILNNGNAANFLQQLNKNVFSQSIALSPSERKEMNLANILAINSPKGYGLDKETFIMKLLSQDLIDKKQSIRKLIESVKCGELYFFDGTKKSIYECPWINSPFMN